jgi:3-deoxy-D-manno-octulosonate 8-phosphate phosphatase KdsC-like HAD superfamily phosphatase
MIFVQPITASTPKSNVNLNSLGCHISNGVWITLTYNMLLFLFNNNTRCDSALTSSWPTRYETHIYISDDIHSIVVINAICMRDCSADAARSNVKNAAKFRQWERGLVGAVINSAQFLC